MKWIWRACRSALVCGVIGSPLPLGACGGADDPPAKVQPKDSSAPDDVATGDAIPASDAADGTDATSLPDGGDATEAADAADLGADACPAVSSDAKDPETGATTTCGTGCLVDLSNDSSHCGRCDHACRPGEACVTGICDDVATALSALRWELPCIIDDAGDALCVSTPPTTRTATLTGTPGITYNVTLRFRGVAELETYFGGTSDGAYFQTGGTPGGDGWNVYRMDVSEPAQTFFLNGGIGGKYFCVPIDYTKTIKMKAGSKVTLVADPVDAGMYEIKNLDEKGVPIVVPGVPPAPLPFHGQFIQMDILSVSAAS